MIERLAIIGVGLIGGSFALALRAAGAVREIVGYGRRLEPLALAREQGVVDRTEREIAAAVAGADLIFIAVPLGAMPQIFAQLRAAGIGAAVLTDAGSAKASVLDAARTAFGSLPPRLVPGHPIAGSERSGVEAARADLFIGQRILLTPTPQTDPAALALVRDLWERVGAVVEELDAASHDMLLAMTSHLPHVLAFALMQSFAQHPQGDRLLDYAGGGLRDFSRIAGSDPVMWRDIALYNRVEIKAALAGYRAALDDIEAAIAAGDGDALHRRFAAARALRARLAEARTNTIC